MFAGALYHDCDWGAEEAPLLVQDLSLTPLAISSDWLDHAHSDVDARRAWLGRDPFRVRTEVRSSDIPAFGQGLIEAGERPAPLLLPPT